MTPRQLPVLLLFFSGAMLLPVAVLGDGQDPKSEAVEALEKESDPDSERLIELSVQFGRLQRLRAALNAGEQVGMGDYRGAIGRGTVGPQERLAAEREAVIALKARLEALKGESRARARPQVTPLNEIKANQVARPLSVGEALQVMGPAPVKPNLVSLGDLLRDAGQHELALDNYQKIPVRQRSPWVVFSMAVCYEHLGRLKKAHMTYVKVAREATGTPLGHHALWVARTYLPQLEATLAN